MTFQEVIANAKTCIGTKCHACPVCNGKACRNTMPGPGSKGVGDTAIRNYDKWQEIRVNMDTLCEGKPVNQQTAENADDIAPPAPKKGLDMDLPGFMTRKF